MDGKIKKKIEDFFSEYNPEEYKKDQFLIRDHEDPRGIFYLKEGIVKQYTTSENGIDLTLNIYKPPSFFPMSWALNDSPNRYSFEVVTKKVVVMKATKEEVINFLKKEPEVLFDLVKRVFSGIEGLLAHMEYLMSGNAHSKLVITLIIMSKRFGTKIRLTEKEIASYAGLSRETVSREIQKLKEKNLISNKNKILTIFDINRLEEEISLH